MNPFVELGLPGIRKRNKQNEAVGIEVWGARGECEDDNGQLHLWEAGRQSPHPALEDTVSPLPSHGKAAWAPVGPQD